MSKNEKIAIKVQGVSKDFILPHESQDSLKSKLLHPLKRSSGSEKQHALRDISFEVKKGEFFGIVGRNGSGKSTLLKILAEIYMPTKGKVTVNGSLTPFIELGVGFNPELTGRENVYLNGAMLGFSKKEMGKLYSEIVEFAELEKFMDQKLKNYSSGMQVRLAFSVAIRARSDILLLDEVLAVGDADFQRKCFDYFRDLKKNKETVVFVTHDMSAVREYCDQAILIDNSKIIARGNPREVSTKYTRLFEKEQNNNVAGASSGKRWGDGSIKFKVVELSSKSLAEKDGELRLSVQAVATGNLEHDSTVGFYIYKNDGTMIQGINTKMQGYTIKPLKKGDKVEFEWNIPNIFEDGKYGVGLSLVSSDFAHTYDWWEDAASFRSFRTEKTPYAVAPANISITPTGNSKLWRKI